MRLGRAGTIALIALVAVAPAGATPTREAATHANFVLMLKGPPTVEKRYVQGGLGNGWTIPDSGGTVTWSPPFGTATYEWSMPQGIPPSGANVKMTVTVDASPTSRFAPAMGISGSLVKGGQLGVGTLAEPGKSNSASATAELVPGSGTQYEVKVGIQDGPTYTYTYVAKPVGNVSVKLGYGIFEPGRELSSGHVAVGTTIQLEAKATPAIPNGATLHIFDKPQGSTQAPKSGYLIRSCKRERCTVNRTERTVARVHAYRAFVVLGNVTNPGYKVIGQSNPVVIHWDEPRIRVELLVQTTNGGLFEPSGKVPTGAQVTLRADAVDPLPPGTQIRITWELDPGGYGGLVKVCSASPCIGYKSYRLPASISFSAVVVRPSAKLRELGRSKTVRVAWTPR